MLSRAEQQVPVTERQDVEKGHELRRRQYDE